MAATKNSKHNIEGKAILVRNTYFSLSYRMQDKGGVWNRYFCAVNEFNATTHSSELKRKTNK